MADELKRYGCKRKGCRRAAFWIERDEGGELFMCFRERHDGGKHIQRVKLSDLEGVIKKARAGAFDAHARESADEASRGVVEG